MLAGIVADNVLVQARTREPVLGTQNGEQRQMQRRFEWELETANTDMPGFLRLTVNIREGDNPQILMTRTAFYSQQKNLPPVPLPAPPTDIDTPETEE
jgi:hypothetical protein